MCLTEKASSAREHNIFDLPVFEWAKTDLEV